MYYNNTPFITRNSHRIALLLSVVLWTPITGIMLCVMYFSLESYIADGDTSQIVPMIFLAALFIFFDIWIYAMATESIEVRDGFLIIRYLFFKKTYPISSITEVYINIIHGNHGTKTYNTGVYINGKRIVLPLLPDPTWEGYNLWSSFTSSLNVEKTLEDGTIEMWPFGKIGKRRIVGRHK